MSKPRKTIALFCNTARAMVQFRSAIIRDLIDKSYHVVAIAQPDGVAEHELTALGAVFEPIALSRSGINPIKELKLLGELISILRRVRPALLINYTIKPNVYATPVARVLGIPAISVVTGLGYAFLSDTLIARIARFLLGKGLLMARHVWFLNREDLDVVCGKRSDLRARSSVLPGEGIDTNYYAPRAMPLPPIRFLLIARMLADKGFREYVNAAKLIGPHYPDVQFDLVGPLDPDNPAGIAQSEIDEATAHPQINYLGSTDDVRPFIENAHCVVLPSYREGVPRVLLEGAAMQRPVIATDVPGCRDALIDGKTGLLCAARDAKDIARCFGNFIDMSDKERFQMGKAGRKNVIEKFDDRTICAHYYHIIAKLDI